MPILHGLRLNCVLAPVVAAAVGCAAVLLGWSWHARAWVAASDAAHLGAISGYAHLSETDSAPAPAAWLDAHAGWTGLARVRIRDGAIEVLQHAGEVPLRSEAPPELMLAYQSARSWSRGGLLACADPSLPRGGGATVVIGWRAVGGDPEATPWIALALAVLAIGGGLGAYLVARVYRPVEWLQRAAEAATIGGAEPPGAPAGPETASLRSSIATLIAQRRHSDGGDEHA